jgi:hypothetical protein
LLDLGFGERVEIDDDVRPGRRAITCGDPIFQMPFQHLGQEVAEHMTANGLVELVEDHWMALYAKRLERGRFVWPQAMALCVLAIPTRRRSELVEYPTLIGSRPVALRHHRQHLPSRTHSDLPRLRRHCADSVALPKSMPGNFFGNSYDEI